MPVIPRASQDDAARFAHIITALTRMEALLKMFDEAAQIYIGLPKGQKISVDNSVDSLSMNVTYGLARTNPVQRLSERGELEQEVHALEDMAGGAPSIQFEATDLDLIIDFVAALGMLESRSKRELGRLFDAIDANDTGTLTARAVPSKGNMRQRLEINFSQKISA